MRRFLASLLLLLPATFSIIPASASDLTAGSTITVAKPTSPAFDGNPCSAPARDDPTCPIWNRCSRLQSCTGDAPDPSVVKAGSTYVAFTTGTALGNSIQVLVSNSVDSGYHAWPMADCTGPDSCRSRSGSSAFGALGDQGLPSWTIPGTQIAPAAVFLGGRWLLYFAGRSRTTGRFCIGVAELNPIYRSIGRTIAFPTSATSPPLFQSASDTPLRCEPPVVYGTSVGVVDPSVFVDPTSGAPFLLYKTNDGSSSLPARLLSQPLSPNGLTLLRGANLLLTQDTVGFPWSTTIENPELGWSAGSYHLLYSAGQWDSAGYVEADAVCAGPAGPCWPSPSPVLKSRRGIAGPGGASLLTVRGTTSMAFHAWDPTCIGYAGSVPAGSCTTGARHLFVTEVSW